MKKKVLFFLFLYTLFFFFNLFIDVRFANIVKPVKVFIHTDKLLEENDVEVYIESSSRTIQKLLPSRTIQKLHRMNSLNCWYSPKTGYIQSLYFDFSRMDISSIHKITFYIDKIEHSYNIENFDNVFTKKEVIIDSKNIVLFELNNNFNYSKSNIKYFQAIINWEGDFVFLGKTFIHSLVTYGLFLIFLYIIFLVFNRSIEIYNTKYIIKNKFIYLFITFFILFFYFYSIINSVNFPFWDDFDSIIIFINKFYESQSINSKIQLVFEQLNEHRIVFNKLITLCSTEIFNNINFKALMIIGNLNLILLSFFFYLIIGKNEKRLLIFLPVIFFLFNTEYWLVIFMATPSIQFLTSLSFCFYSLFFLCKPENRYYIILLLLSILAFFTNSNGILIFVISIFYLTLNRKYFKAIIISILFIILMIINNIILNNKSGLLMENIIYVMNNIVDSLFYFCNHISSSVSFGSHLFTGILIMCLFFIIIKNKYYKTSPVLFLILVFLISISILTLLSRSMNGPNQALTTHYKIFSLLVIISLYLIIILNNINKIKLFYLYLFIVFAVLFNINSFYSNHKSIINHRNMLITNQLKWQFYDLDPSANYSRKANESLKTIESIKKFKLQDYSVLDIYY